MMILWREHGDIDKIQEKIKNVKSALQVFLIFCKNTKLLFLDSQHKIFSGLAQEAYCIISSKIQLHHVFLEKR